MLHYDSNKIDQGFRPLFYLGLVFAIVRIQWALRKMGSILVNVDTRDLQLRKGRR